MSVVFSFFALTSLAQADVDFEKQIKPIFEAACVKCHGADKQEAGLRLDLKEAALSGGDSGEVIVPGNAEESLLFKLVSGADPDRPMPPNDDALNEKQLNLFKLWINDGANWPE